MITFKQFLLRESRMQSVEIDSATNWMDQYASGYLDHGVFLYRGTRSDNRDGILEGDSNRGEERKSANTFNYYTLFMDNHPSFKEFPKRSRSFICSTNKEYAGGFGAVYIVVPADPLKVGMVGQQDLWGINVCNSDMGLEDLNGYTYDALRVHDLPQSDNSWSVMKTNLQKITQDFVKDFKHSPAKMLMKQFSSMNMFEVWENALKPSLFTLATAEKLPNKKGEVWVQGDCIFIPTNQSQISQQDQFELLEWSKREHPKFHRLLKSHWTEDFTDRESGEKIDPDSVSDEDILDSKKKQQNG